MSTTKGNQSVLGIAEKVGVSAILCLGAALAISLRKHARKKHEDIEELRNLTVPDDSIFQVFQDYLVPMSVLEERGYSSLLSLVQILIGTRPTCDMVLEIWPPAFQTYNIIVPNFLNLPESILGVGGALPSDLKSLSMYASSRANQCAYCTSHCCSYGVRRGVDPSAFKSVLEAEKSDLSPQQRAVVNMAVGLGTVPCSLTKDHVNELAMYLTPAQMEWAVAAAAMFGAFNKYMDALGIPLERDTYAETVKLMDDEYSINSAGQMLHQNRKTRTPPAADTWTEKLYIIFHGVRPGGAIITDRRLQAGTPMDWQSCRRLLNERFGLVFAFLDQIKVARFRRALTSVLLVNSDDRHTAGLGLLCKARVAVHYCNKILENHRLQEEWEVALTTNQTMGTKPLSESLTNLVLRVAHAVSFSPSRMTAELVQQIEDCPELTPAMIVELVSFLASVQMMHRVECFCRRKKELDIGRT